MSEARACDREVEEAANYGPSRDHWNRSVLGREWFDQVDLGHGREQGQEEEQVAKPVRSCRLEAVGREGERAHDGEGNG